MRVPELKVPPVLVLIASYTLMELACRLLPWAVVTLPAGRILGALLIGAGSLIMLAGIVEFRRVGTTVDPRYPERSSRLVERGIFRLTRNPMYLGMLLLLIGWGVGRGNYLALLVPAIFALLITRLQIIPEERVMAQKFGDQFQNYQSRVRRWL